MLRFTNALLCVGLLPMAAIASVPKQINHQGVVSVDGVAFDGPGLFRFAIVDPGGQYLWTNDGSTPTPPDPPSTAVTRQVVKGVYTVMLGDINDPDMPNMTEEISSSLFNVNNARLRIWFNDGVNGIQRLEPDHKLTATPYAHRVAVMPPIGSIIAWHKDFTGVPALPDGWLECDGVTVIPDGPLADQTMPDLNFVAGRTAGRFLRGASTSGEMQRGTRHYNRGDAILPANNRWVLDGDGGEVLNSLIQPYSPAFPPTTLARHYTVSKPVNMTVVWIMRVK